MKPITRKQYADKLDAWIGKGQIIVLTGQRRVGKSKFVWKTGKWIAAGFQTRGIRTYTHIFRLQRRGTATGIYQAISVQRSSFNVKKMLPFRVFQTHFLLNFLYFHGFKNPRLFALRASRPSDAFLWRMSDGRWAVKGRDVACCVRGFIRQKCFL